MKIRKFARCLVALAMFASVGVHANLVTNGGFETGDFTGWSTFGFGPFGFDGVDSSVPQSGTYAAFFGEPVAAPSGISQTLATTAGKLYTVSFWLANEVDPNGNGIPNSFAFNWNGGAAELTLNNVVGPTAYTQYSFTLLATSALTGLQFTFASDPAFWDFDNVSVNAAPEPGSLALVALGGGVIAAFRRRRRQA
jgi:PEP-CTERM motif